MFIEYYELDVHNFELGLITFVLPEKTDNAKKWFDQCDLVRVKARIQSLFLSL